ncbi:MAG: hypothetical protein FWG71_11035, partial [Synergistaceae bacterium]|nr:hypothetical protein [Synergistaceae bacterium]
MRVIHTETSEVRLALTETGLASEKSSTSSNTGGGGTTFDPLTLSAISDAVNRLSYAIRSNLGQETAHIVRISDNSYIIDLGATTGVKTGALYLVYAEGDPITGINNQQLGREKFPLAILRVTRVENAHSVCVLERGSNGNLVQIGDNIEPISQTEAKAVKFAASRS